jgi:hypothetical protein
MKTRMIYTRFWIDDYICSLSHKEKLAFIYFITNERVNLCGIYELPDKYIKIDLELTQKELDTIKEKFMRDGKFVFINGWVKIVNHESYSKFTGEFNEKAKIKELALIPQEIIQYQYPIGNLSTKNVKKECIHTVLIPYKDGVDTSTNTNNNNNTNTNNNKEGVVKGKQLPYKIKYADFVYMTKEEYQKLITQYGEKNTKAFIEKLSIWKGANGKTKPKGSDYLKILNWVVEAVLGKSENRKPNEPKSWQALRELKEEYDKEAINDSG